MPAATVLPTVNVNDVEALLLVGLKLPVTPAGKPDRVNATTPANPLSGTTLIVLEALDPDGTVNAPEDEERLKLDVWTVTGIVMELVNVPEVPTTATL